MESAWPAMAVRRVRAVVLAAALASLCGLAACGGGEEEAPPEQVLDPDERVRVRHILVQYSGAFGAPVSIRRSRGAADSLAREVRRMAAEGEKDFRVLAREYSDDASAEQGGEIATLRPGDAPPEFMEAAVALEPGAISEVVESAYGFHIIQRRDISTIAAQHILIRFAGAEACPDSITRTRAEALELIERIHAKLQHPDASFPVAARDFSEDSNAERGGYLGIFPRGKMVPAFEEVAFALNVGEISDVVETPFGFHLIRRIEAETIHVSHILLTYAGLNQLVEADRSREDALQLALDAAFRAQQGEDFVALARELSDDQASGERGGRLPPMRPGVYVPEFEDAAYQLQPGEVSEVIETIFGFHVIRRDR